MALKLIGLLKISICHSFLFVPDVKPLLTERRAQCTHEEGYNDTNHLFTSNFIKEILLWRCGGANEQRNTVVHKYTILTAVAGDAFLIVTQSAKQHINPNSGLKMLLTFPNKTSDDSAQLECSSSSQ